VDAATDDAGDATKHDSGLRVEGGRESGVDATSDDASDATTDDSGPLIEGGHESGVDATSDDASDATTDATPAVIDVLGPFGASAAIPSNAIADSSAIAISVTTSGYPALPSNVETLGNIYAFTPHGQSFASPVLISVPFGAAADALSPALYAAEPGGSWTTVQDAQQVGTAMEADVDQFSYFFVGLPQGWTNVTGPVPNSTSLSVIVQWNGLVFVAAGDSGVYEAPALGSASWAAYTTGLPAGTTVTYLAADSNAIYAATSAGVFTSVPGTSMWTSTSSGLPSGVWTVASNNGVLFAGTDTQGTRMFVSTNGGASWTPSDSGLQESESYATFATWVVSGTVLTTGAGSLFYSGDNGVSWQMANYTNGAIVRSVTTCNGTWFLGTDNGLFSSSTVNGPYAQSISVPDVTANGPDTNVYATVCVGSRLYIGISDSGVAYSDDNGASFTTFQTGFATAANGIYPSIISLAYGNGSLLAVASETWLNADASYLYAAPTPVSQVDGGSLTTTPGCSTCLTTTLPVCPDPNPNPDAFGLTCCPSNAPYFLCNGEVGCTTVPMCCDQTCSCTLSCTAGGGG
jgi:hypothetical protein